MQCEYTKQFNPKKPRDEGADSPPQYLEKYLETKLKQTWVPQLQSKPNHAISAPIFFWPSKGYIVTQWWISTDCPKCQQIKLMFWIKTIPKK